MTRRLLLSYLGITVFILVALDLPLAVLAQRFERQLATSQAERDASGLVAVVNDDLERSELAQLASQIAAYQHRTGGEVIVLSPAGRLVAASSDDADNDAVQDWGGVTRRALGGQTATSFTSDEGSAYAVAATAVSEEGRPAGVVVLGNPAGLTDRRVHEIWLALAAFTGGALLLAAIAGLMLSRSMARPLARLEATVSRFAGGDLSARASESAGPGEIRGLAHQFNQMAARLAESTAAQRQLVADASHQLRSPLTALRLRMENLEATTEGPAAGQVAALGREVQRLSRLVDGLMTLGQAEEVGPAPEPVDVWRVVAERCDAWSALADEKGVSVNCRVEGAPAPTDLVRSLHSGDLDQMLDNLLANALEVTPAGTAIEVKLVRGTAGNLEVHVIDCGPGLSDADRRRAFDRFWQAPDRPTGSSGLGLAIVRRLADRNGVTVELRAGQPGGLDAVVTLPA